MNEKIIQLVSIIKNEDLTLEGKLDLISKHFEETSYMRNMIYAVNEANKGNKDYSIMGNRVYKTRIDNQIIWDLIYILGEVVMEQYN